VQLLEDRAALKGFNLGLRCPLAFFPLEVGQHLLVLGEGVPSTIEESTPLFQGTSSQCNLPVCKWQSKGLSLKCTVGEHCLNSLHQIDIGSDCRAPRHGRGDLGWGQFLTEQGWWAQWLESRVPRGKSDLVRLPPPAAGCWCMEQHHTAVHTQQAVHSMMGSWTTFWCAQWCTHNGWIACATCGNPSGAVELSFRAVELLAWSDCDWEIQQHGKWPLGSLHKIH